MDLVLAIDAMGGDHGVAVTLPAAYDFLASDDKAGVIVVGRDSDIQLDHAASSRFGSRLQCQPASEVIGMHESVVSALRGKKDSSMRVAVDLVKEGRAHAAVSAGNTAALMSVSRFVLKMLPCIDRPAIATALPTLQGQTTMLDLGANVDCLPEHLMQFAIMGSSLVTAMQHNITPRVGLLNVGEEEIKGNELVKRTADLLRNSGLNFIGNVEGDDIFKGVCDVVVCEGFTGNSVLKASEGLAQMISFGLKEEFTRNLLRRISALFALPVINAFKQRFDHRNYNGASLLGLNGVVVKSHGSADQHSYLCALQRAAEAARERLPEKISERINEYISSHPHTFDSVIANDNVTAIVSR